VIYYRLNYYAYYHTLTVAAADKSQHTRTQQQYQKPQIGEEIKKHALIFTPPKNNYGGWNRARSLLTKTQTYDDNLVKMESFFPLTTE
jgi:hypothetical protein